MIRDGTLFDIEQSTVSYIIHDFMDPIDTLQQLVTNLVTGENIPINAYTTAKQITGDVNAERDTVAGMIEDSTGSTFLSGVYKGGMTVADIAAQAAGIAGIANGGSSAFAKTAGIKGEELLKKLDDVNFMDETALSKGSSNESVIAQMADDWNGKTGSQLANNVDEGYNGKGLLDDFTEDAGEMLPNVEKVTVGTRKVTEYALNPNNTSGGANKARVFESALGYNQSNSSHLMQQIQNRLPNSKAVLGTADKYGQRFTVDIPITGPNGKTAIVRTGWILEPGSDVPRMTTVFVK